MAAAAVTFANVPVVTWERGALIRIQSLFTAPQIPTTSPIGYNTIDGLDAQLSACFSGKHPVRLLTPDDQIYIK